MNVTVSIGRNAARGEAVLDAEEWESFALLTRSAVEGLGGEIVQEGYVTGRWGGVEEESFTVTADVEWRWQTHDAEVYRSSAAAAVNRLRKRLSYLAKVYGQEVIALTVADPEFVQAMSLDEYAAYLGQAGGRSDPGYHLATRK